MTVASTKSALVAIVGNPNSGKTSIFNALTGSNQKVGNYPGVTVERVSASLALKDQTVEIVDVPGLYSIHPRSEDEKVAVEVMTGQKGHPKPDLLVCVISAANLERNLFLFTQIATEEMPMVVAISMVDHLRDQGAELDLAKLSGFLGVEVVPVNGHKGKGMAALKEAIERNLANPKRASIDAGRWDALENKVDIVHERFARQGMDSDRDLIRQAILSDEAPLHREVENTPELYDALHAARVEALDEGLGQEREFTDRYRWTTHVAQSVTTPIQVKKRDLTKKLDRILTHRFWGLTIFVGVMYLVFQSIYTLAAPLMDAIDFAISWLGDRVGGLLSANPVLKSLVVDGVITGVGSALVFLPQILILFLFISLLEGSGYLARAAFLMDRLLGWCGLNGRAFIPLLSSFACAVPGVMAARVMPDPRSRLATILVAPLMSCSARLPVYVLLIGAFIEPQFGAGWAGFSLFAMHLLGLVVAIPVAYVLNRGVMKGKRLPFILELPPYQAPSLRDMWLTIYFRGKVFLKTAGTMIFLMSILIWALSFFPVVDTKSASDIWTAKGNTGVMTAEAESRLKLEESYLGQMGRAVQPVFEPAGFDWRITTAILSAFPAREVVVPSLGILFSVGEGAEDTNPDLRKALSEATWPDGRRLMTPFTAVGLMVFFALCAQCMATLAAVKRETNSWKWPVFMFFYMTGLAWLGAVLVHQIGRAFGH